MSSTPLCSGFEFPLESSKSVLAQVGYAFSPTEGISTNPLDMSKVSRLMHDRTIPTLQEQEPDYFGMSLTLAEPQPRTKSTFISPRKPFLREEGGSISSLTSESTLIFNQIGTSLSQNFTQSTETLVDDKLEERTHCPGLNKNAQLLSLNLSRRGTQPSILRSANAQKTDFELLLRRPDVDRKPPHSSTETHFDFARKFPLNTDGTIIQSSPSQLRLDSFPLLRKQVTAPSLSATSEMCFLSNINAEQARRTSYVPPPACFRDTIQTLSPSISYMSAKDVADLVLNAQKCPNSPLRTVLPIDIRPLTDFVKLHLKGAINVCLPLTLLKRQNFNLRKCINSLPEYEKLVFQNHLNRNQFNMENNVVSEHALEGRHGLPAIVVYDSTNNSSGLLCICKKLLGYSCWDEELAPPIILIDGPFEMFAVNHPDAVISGNSDMIDLEQLQGQANDFQSPDSVGPNSPTPLRNAMPIRSMSTPGLLTLGLKPGSFSSTAVSNFFLPQNLPSKQFRIRHNEEVFNTSLAPCSEDDLAAVVLDASQYEHLPQWLAQSVMDKCIIRADFNTLEEKEKQRLNRAFCPQDRTISEETGEFIPTISSGLDYGHKNRYKDIFLFEHSRVKLVDRTGLLRADSDLVYINASHINSKESFDKFSASKTDKQDRLLIESNYLATQGPMGQTVGDFWRCVVNQKALVIICLTAEFENGVEKCYCYWKEGVYQSSDHSVSVRMEEANKIGPIIHRVFTVTLDNEPPHRVTQLQQEDWKDMSADVETEDILLMIAMKKQILLAAPTLPSIPTVVHCSAGCGRTGVFCVADHIINLLENNNSFELPRDPIFEVVDSFRRQRVLMVQSVRQYWLLYRIMIHYSLGQRECEKYLSAVALKVMGPTDVQLNMLKETL